MSATVMDYSCGHFMMAIIDGKQDPVHLINISDVLEGIKIIRTDVGIPCEHCLRDGISNIETKIFKLTKTLKRTRRKADRLELEQRIAQNQMMVEAVRSHNKINS